MCESRRRGDGNARDRSVIARGVLITLAFVDKFCRSVGAQSIAQPWHTDPLTPARTCLSILTPNYRLFTMNIPEILEMCGVVGVDVKMDN